MVTYTTFIVVLLLGCCIQPNFCSSSSLPPPKISITTKHRHEQRAYGDVQLTALDTCNNRTVSKVGSYPAWKTLIKTEEIPKFTALSCMMFLIVFMFTVARDVKDTLIVTNCGAEAIAFLKVYGVVPAASLFLLAYSALATYCSQRTLFYATMSPFLVFYLAFAFLLYPMRNVLHPMSISVPQNGFSYFVNLFRHWTFALYYIVSELWGSAGIPLLFWTCANDVVRIDQAKRLYPMVSLIGNLGPVLGGVTMSTVSRIAGRYAATEEGAFQLSLQVLAVCSAAAGVLVCALYAATMRMHDAELTAAVLSQGRNSYGVTVPAATNLQPTVTTAVSSTVSNSTPTPTPTRKSKPTLSFAQSLRVLAGDPYLRNIATMVLAYGVTMEFTEIMWKSLVKRAFPVKTEYLAFLATYSTYAGVAAFLMMFVGTGVVDGLGWRAGALVTPVAMGLTALLFFAALISQKLNSRAAILTVVYAGMVQNIVSKASKYAVFDPVKEMAYIPLDAESKTRGKAAIDVLGARLGKSAGALVQQVLVLVLGSILQGAPVIAALFYVVLFAWIGAVNSLAPMFAAKSAIGTGCADDRHKHC